MINSSISGVACLEFIFYMEKKVCCPDLKFSPVSLEKLHRKFSEQHIFVLCLEEIKIDKPKATGQKSVDWKYVLLSLTGEKSPGGKC